MAIKKLKTLNFGGEDTYELTPEWDKIENKPFGEETKVLVDNQELVYNTESQAFLLENVILTEGNIYTVVIGGVRYENLIAKHFAGMAFIGNSAAFGMPDTGEPFACVTQDNASMLVFLDGSTVCKSFTLEEAVITKLNPKYYESAKLTRFYFNAFDSESYLYKDINFEEKATVEDLYNANEDGYILILFSTRMVYTPIIVNCSGVATGEPGEVVIVEYITGSTPKAKILHTAEYTGE